MEKTDDERRRASARALADRIDEALRLLEERPNMEDAFELLIAARWASGDGAGDGLRLRAVEWERRVGSVLARDEFRLPPEAVAERISRILGEPIPGPVRGPHTGRSEPGSFAPIQPSSAGVGETVGSPAPGEASPQNGHPAVLPRPAVETIIPAGPSHEPAPLAVALAGDGPILGAAADADLQRLASRWPTLPAHVKATIMMLVGAADQSLPDRGI